MPAKREPTKTKACQAPVGYTPVAGDCNDYNKAIHPGAAETWYDGVDSDCNGCNDYDQDGDGQDDHGRWTLYINGVYQQKNTYSVATNVITFSEAPPYTATIEVNYV